MIDLPLRISGALAGLAMVLAFLHSALQVAVINREKGRLAGVPPSAGSFTRLWLALH
jgi:hypothetical protein